MINIIQPIRPDRIRPCWIRADRLAESTLHIVPRSLFGVESIQSDRSTEAGWSKADESAAERKYTSGAAKHSMELGSYANFVVYVQ